MDGNIKHIYYRYETSDGQKRDETGQLKDAPPTPENPNNKVIDIFGSYEFTSPEGMKKIIYIVFIEFMHLKNLQDVHTE